VLNTFTFVSDMLMYLWYAVARSQTDKQVLYAGSRQAVPTHQFADLL
jgi:hypothetical protein